MIAASIDQVRADISDPKRTAVFKATGSSIRDPGFLRAYQEGLEETETSDTKESYLPKLTIGQKLGLIAIKNKQHFTEPPSLPDNMHYWRASAFIQLMLDVS